MITQSFARTAFAAAILGACASSALAQSFDIPSSLDGPEKTVVRTLHAEGALIYDCAKDGDKMAWKMREPIAALFEGGKNAGRYVTGGEFDTMDGSKVSGKPVANMASPTPGSIPWLRLAIAKNEGSGSLAPAKVILRINTRGGALAGACVNAGGMATVAYSADYVFVK